MRLLPTAIMSRMSEGRKNPYSELMRKLEGRMKEIASQDVPIGRCIKNLMDLFAEGDQRFAAMLANRQGTTPADFESLYRLKAELEQRLIDRDSNDPRP